MSTSSPCGLAYAVVEIAKLISEPDYGAHKTEAANFHWPRVAVLHTL